MTALREDSQLVLVARIFWMMLGPALMLLCIALILNAPGAGWRTTIDLAFFLILAATIAGRVIEHLGGCPRNGLGEPATAWELRRYVLVAVPLATAAWAVANYIANRPL